MTDDLIREVHKLIYDADPEIPAAAVIALVRAAVADEIRALRIKLEDQYSEGYNDAIRGAARIADPSRARETRGVDPAPYSVGYQEAPHD